MGDLSAGKTKAPSGLLVDGTAATALVVGDDVCVGEAAAVEEEEGGLGDEKSCLYARLAMGEQ